MQSKGEVPRVSDSRGYGAARGNGQADSVRVGSIDAELLRECIDTVGAAGDAILFGRTQDGGAIVVRVLSDKGNGAYYPPTQQALENVLTRIADIARGM